MNGQGLALYRFHPMVLFYWTVAFAVWEWLFVAVSLKMFPDVGTFQEYYRKLPSWVPISGDYLYSTLIFLSAQWVFAWMTPFVASVPTLAAVPSLVLFAFLFIALQWVYDLLWATLVLALPAETSRYIHFFQRYIRQVGFSAAIGDSLYLLAWLAVAWLLLTYVPISVALYLLIAALFFWLVFRY
jgi:hypothetical protein